MNTIDAYFRNNVQLMGKVTHCTAVNDEFVGFELETKETWPDGETLLERHEVRYYNTPQKPALDVEALYGHLVEIRGRIRLKDSDALEYRPFIHCHELQKVRQ